ncbi:hypothetical protein F4678DRAFT_463409 [Xylaria arbuscula]|nr:hypothetical protein F4678DRAFT_463409 [Xylaria arbuscula]
MVGRSVSEKLPFLPLAPSPVLPIKINGSNVLHRRHLCKSTVLFVDDDIVVKMYNQFRVADVELPSGELYLELSLAGFVADILKLVGFSTSPSPPSAEQIERYEADNIRLHPTEIFGKNIQTAHQRLASCLHYLLSGVDPDKEASGFRNLQDLTRFREKVRSGGYAVQPDASPITDVLQAAWTLKAGTESFASIAEKVSSALNQLEIEPNEALPPHIPDQYYLSLGDRCLEWLRTQEKNSEWMERSKYKSACERVGFWCGGL